MTIDNTHNSSEKFLSEQLIKFSFEGEKIIYSRKISSVNEEKWMRIACADRGKKNILNLP